MGLSFEDFDPTNSLVLRIRNYIFHLIISNTGINKAPSMNFIIRNFFIFSYFNLAI